jgi:hypothetical protein
MQNPATDEQVMGRCWRDGQTKTVFIYRFLSVGSIEECIFQRQIKKNEFKITEESHVSGTAESAAATSFASTSSTSASAESLRHFSTEDLKDIFTLTEPQYCRTYDLLHGDGDRKGPKGTATTRLSQDFEFFTTADHVTDGPLHVRNGVGGHGVGTFLGR